MHTPYTYLLRHKPTNKYYYGVRFAQGCNPDEFWVKYKTSSKHVKELINKYGEDSFEYEIRKTFKTVDLARIWESKVLKRLKVISREDFINKTDNISIDPNCSRYLKGKTGKDHPAYGNIRSDVSLRNSKQTGELNPMFVRKGALAPCYGRTGEKHPMFGKKNIGASKKCKEVIVCPYCNKSGQRSGMQRWHFNNCTNKKGVK
jgi:hypothetical protein